MMEPDRKRSHGLDDTSDEAWRVQMEALRRIPPERRLELMDDLTALAQSMMREGIAQRHPEYTPEQREREYFEIALGKELATKVLASRAARRTGGHA